ncbi:Fatty acid desaturase family protein [Roseibacterium elongatum DSM 19469]|uniref:Fatty acid desaturase family protein n=1 Tax=Roseicyclus elongatus DSM 19469 TaxID=1294273 RepID=W8RND9_9RHOB|nr:fatty acid desaturase [Roseibacterium elongatum]AHM02513.1 Fatty acid desaturase family protein [Roseibacterium elongatum DSM 19469]
MRIEWPTLALIAACYAVWGAALFWLVPIAPPIALACVAVAIAFQSSLQHEVLHGHPFAARRWGEPLVFASLNLAVPYLRFRDTHLAHHMDACLTDPYDDPESNYLDPALWARLPRWQRAVLQANNTLLGRMTLGPMIGQVAFMVADWRRLRAGAPGVLAGWLWHLPSTAGVLWIVAASPMSVPAYLLACYVGLGLLKIRTFLEHQAHEHARGRTVIIEDRGPLAFLFLNNNLHVVHHMHPKLPWYRLPRIYAENRDRYLKRNDGYRYDSYAQVFRRHLLAAKDPVPHPLFPGRHR